MSKLILMEDAAQMLGMSVERLTELRSNNEIFGYRDGSTWKFKRAEIERVAEELDIDLDASNASAGASDVIADAGASQKGGSAADLSGFELTQSAKDLLLDDDEMSESFRKEMDSVEMMEDSSAELFTDSMKSKMGQSKSEKTSEPAPLADDEVDLDDDDDVLDLADSGRLDHLLDSGGSASFAGASGILASEDNVIDDEEEDELAFGTSSLKLASESSRKLQGNAGSDVMSGESSKTGGADDTGKLSGDDLSLSEEDLFSDELTLQDDSSFGDSSDLGSDFEDSDDLVLDDSDSSTEITLEKNESGINLSASESGISLLDEPLELGGSDIDALELPEDDDMIVLEDAAGPDQPTMMQEDDFNLTPLADSFDDDDSSGSQVIALEDSEIYADDTGGLLGEDEFEAQPALLDDDMGGDFGGAYAGAGMPGQLMVPAGPAALPEAPYSVWQVVSLGLVAMLLLTGSMIAYNLAQNMWMPEDQVIGSSVLNFFLDLTGMN